jgi:hypothetical protein
VTSTATAADIGEGDDGGGSDTGGGGLAKAVDLVREGAEAAARGDLAAAIAAYRDAVQRFADVERPIELARAHHDLLGLCSQAAVIAGSLEPPEVMALLADVRAAVEAVEAARRPLAAEAGVARWAVETVRTFALAVVICQSLGQHRAAVELLDRVRALGVPDVPDLPDASGTSGTSDASDDVEAGGAGGALDPAVHAVRAALGDLGVASPPPADGASAGHVVGGPFAWRWTLWRAGAVVFWGLVDVDGRADSGLLGVELPGDEAGPLPAEVRAALAQLDAVGPTLERWMAAPPDAEPEPAWEAGRRLVPSALATELHRRLRRDGDPLPLVIGASPSLEGLPFGMISIAAPTDEHPQGRRLLEAAVVSHAAAPTVLDARSRHGRRSPAPPLPLVLALGDPPVDAVAAGPVVHGRDEVLDALRSLGRGRPGALWWDGRTAGSIAAEDLLGEGLHVPTRVVVVGVAPPASGRLVAALLHAGAAAVASARTDDGAADVLRLATEADDLATGLRDLQRRWLRAGDTPQLRAGWAVAGLHYG